jgi:hypothetical protein
MSFFVTTGVVLYVVAMALVFGGTAALSFAAAPHTFRTLKAADAGTLFGKVLRTFDAMTSLASAVAVVAGAATMAVEIAPTSIALVLIAASVQAIVTLLRKSLTPKMAALKPPTTEDEARRWDPESRRRFDAFHRLYVRLYASNLFLSLVGLVIATLAASR